MAFFALFRCKSKIFRIILNLIFIFLVLCMFFHPTPLDSSSSNATKISVHEDISCNVGNLRDHDKCSYVKSHESCRPEGYISYLELFYCRFTPPSLGYFLIFTWLVLLFYLLGDTSSKYFCTSLEGLSSALKLSPTVSGVTLLSLGNGAPDVFSAVISFMGNHEDTKDLGLNSILGGVFFVTTVVIGVVSISVSHQERRICPSNFIGNSLFLLFSLSVLLVFIFIGNINFWGALCFFSLYFIYVALVLTSEFLDSNKDIWENDFIENDNKAWHPIEFEDLEPHPNRNDRKHRIFRGFCYMLEFPLDLPRKLTIPIFGGERWSRPIGVTSIALAPLLLGVIWNLHYQKPWILVSPIVAVLGSVLFLALFFTSDEDNPPRKYTFIWIGVSFIMSITWTYLLAQELVSAMVSLGVILGISHSVIGLTVLAWGNSIGDLVSNLTMAKYCGPGGVQTAVSGCYAGPIINLIVGLGISLVYSGWSVWPTSYVIAKDSSIYETVGFLMVGLIWALVILVKRNMRLDKMLGFGLIAIYSCFIILKMARSVGVLDSHVSLIMHNQL